MKGETPGAAEAPSSKDLDPWETPGTPIGDATGSDQNSAPIGLNTAENTGNISAQPEKTVEEFGSAADYSQSSSSSSDSSKEDETQVKDEIQYNVAELTVRGQRVCIARGGEGGLGNVSAVNVFDGDESSLRIGLPGSETVLILELKSIADVSLVGMPNAGKSTLLGAISRAKPAVGSYAFTTLRPNLGNLNFEDLSPTVADVPGLIKGAHENRGLGHAFLRHIERTKVLAYVVDLASGLDGKGTPPWEQLRDLVLELEYHLEGLSIRPSLIVANKIDEDGAEEVYEELKRRVQDVSIFPVCAVLEEGVAELKDGLKMLVNGEISDRIVLEKIMVD